ncbi:MAG: Gfo/Idh/MocA family oxidoreductase [Chloroflexi bacterium]|nr:Gfo/Idh/MocA family oxidoreductase [Chloroflexota bacterium]
MTTSDDVAPGRGLRLAFAGVAHWHFSVDARYLEQVRAAEAEIVGVSDDDEALAKRRAEELGCGWTADVGDLVTRFKPDLVVALPRPDRAPEQVGRLLDLDVPLFAEKPLGIRASDTWSLVERAERGWVTVAFPQRYLPMWDALERLGGLAGLGELAHVGFRQVNGPPWRYRQYDVPWMLDPAIAGGGPLRNIGIHLADALVRLLGDRGLSVVGASATNRVHGERIEDAIAAILRTDDGVIATLTTGYSFAAPKPGDMDIHLAGKNAYLIQRRDDLQIYPAEGAPERTPVSQITNLYRTLFFDALRRFRAGAPPAATVRDCARANDLIDAIYATAR